MVSSKPIFNAGTERFMRDWRSGIVTVTVRDSRMRQHDPILGVVPLKLSDILQTSSQVTRWYPLDGGIGFGRVRISVLFRSVETRLPPQQLGWDVGTFEFTSDKILATGYHSNAKLKMRTGGSTGKVGKGQCKKTDEGDGVYWDLGEKDKAAVRLPVKYRYRSPIVFELHTSGLGKRSIEGYAVIWLHHLEDNKEENISIPIWKTDKGMRLTQNYITEQNFKDIPDIMVEEIGRIQFRGRFKAGMDHDHKQFITDNDSRETHETWSACHAEGVREDMVTKDMPPAVQKLHDQSLTQGRDVLVQADEKEKKKWLAKDGNDWSGAFGKDPAQYADRRGSYKDPRNEDDNDVPTARTGVINKPAGTRDAQQSGTDEDEDDYDSDSSSSSDLGIHDAGNDEQFQENNGPLAERNTNAQDGKGSGINPIKSVKSYNETRDAQHRKQRGLMQWKPMRNIRFAGNEAKFAVRRTLKKGSLSGRQPDVETEA